MVRFLPFGALISATLGMVYVLAWIAGVAPASAGQRQHIQDVRVSFDLNQYPRTAAALRLVEQDWYTSRTDYERFTTALLRDLDNSIRDVDLKKGGA